MVSGIFTRPRARPPLAAVSSQQNMLAVSTEDELLAALTSLPRSDGACYGRAINIIADITLTRTVELLRQHSGLLITSSSNARLSTKTAFSPAFFVRQNASGVTIDGLSTTSAFLSAVVVQAFANSGLSILNISVNSAPSAITVASLGTVASALIDGCVADTASGTNASIVSIAAGSTTGVVIRGNRNFRGAISAQSASSCIITMNSALGAITASPSFNSNIISFNTMVGAITVGSTSGNNAITGNAMNGNNITTSTGTGGNSIVGNTNVGTITNASTDAVTSNT
jgi:hypothetical protein